jgi:predicted nuclease of predicted toxin-antitoxin system
MRLLIDMNLTPRWVAFLEAGGHEALHWSMVGAPDAKDTQICEYARQNGFVVLTNDLDFPQILAHTKDAAPSVLLLRGQPLTPEFRADSLLSALRACTKEMALGAILTLDWTKQPRARLLPLK